MVEETVPICRLCLEVVYDGRFQGAESIIITLQYILPNLNFSVSSHPLICSKCTETLQKLFNFKSECLETEKHLQNNRFNGNSIVHLEVFHNTYLENEVKIEKIDKGKTCRLCLQILEGELCLQLGIIEEDMLRRCLPELDLTVSENPVICETCLECLQNQFNFVMSCSDVEERIENYCSTQGANSDGQVNLQDIILVPLKTHTVKFDHNDTCNELTDVKVKLEDDSSSIIKPSELEYDEIFIKDEVNTESGYDHLDFYRNQIKLYEPKTAAEHARAYRARKRSAKPEKAKPKTAAEHAKAYRARKRSERPEKAKPKTAAEHAKAYRARKRSEKPEKAKPKTSTERVREFRNRKRQQLESNQSH